jgi:uncharacterized membrane protein
MESLVPALTIVAALGAGLVAGIFFAFSAFVMIALGQLPSEGGIAAMQSFNVAVLNPVFFLAFFGTAAVSLLLAIAALFDVQTGALYLLAGALLYLIGTIFVTIAFNVPLNNRLASVNAKSAEGAKVWSNYLSAWTTWNHVRTAASLAAAAAFILALR